MFGRIHWLTSLFAQTLELTHRLKELRDKEAALLKETETYRDQLEKICKEKEGLERRVQEASEQRDQAITDRAWLVLSFRAVLWHACIFGLGMATSFAVMHLDRLPPLWTSVH
jgi:hypothetical protein